jgi:hypothetical protein
VHAKWPIFTSPGDSTAWPRMTHLGHEERLPPPRPTARYGFRKETITGMRAATRETGRKRSLAVHFLRLDNWKAHLETLRIAGQSLRPIERPPRRPRCRAGSGYLSARERRCKRTT